MENRVIKENRDHRAKWVKLVEMALTVLLVNPVMLAKRGKLA